MEPHKYIPSVQKKLIAQTSAQYGYQYTSDNLFFWDKKIIFTFENDLSLSTQNEVPDLNNRYHLRIF